MNRLDMMEECDRLAKVAEKLATANATLKTKLFKAEAERGVMFEVYDEQKKELEECKAKLEAIRKEALAGNGGRIPW